MTKIREDVQKKIESVFRDRSFAEYTRNYFSQADKNGTPKIDNILNNVYSLAISAESEQIQLAAAKEIRETLALSEPKEIKQENTQINFYQNASNQINENVQRLIAASATKETEKEKKGIEKII